MNRALSLSLKITLTVPLIVFMMQAVPLIVFITLTVPLIVFITLTVPLIVFIIQAVTRFTYGANQGCGGKVNTTTGLNSKQHFSK